MRRAGAANRGTALRAHGAASRDAAVNDHAGAPLMHDHGARRFAVGGIALFLPDHGGRRLAVNVATRLLALDHDPIVAVNGAHAHRTAAAAANCRAGGALVDGSPADASALAAHACTSAA